MTKSENTNIYVSISKDDDSYIDTLRLEKMKSEKRHYTKNDIIKHLLNLGIAVENEKYIKLDDNLDAFVSQMQNMVIEMNGEKITIKKSKTQVYTMLVEKGLQHLND